MTRRHGDPFCDLRQWPVDTVCFGTSTGNVKEATNHRVVTLYRRTVSAVLAMKRLIAVTDIRDAPIPFGARLGQRAPTSCSGCWKTTRECATGEDNGSTPDKLCSIRHGKSSASWRRRAGRIYVWQGKSIPAMALSTPSTTTCLPRTRWCTNGTCVVLH